MTAYVDLINLYSEAGYDVRVGANPYHFDNMRDVPFAALFKDNQKASTGGGVSIQEIYFFESLMPLIAPKQIYSVGNAFGWSTLLFNLLCPESNVLCLDACCEGEHSSLGFNLTKDIAQRKGFKLNLVNAFSPQDVFKVLSDHHINEVDFVFIDGQHSNEQLVKDFIGIHPFCTPNCIYVFHDVVNWNLQEGFAKVQAIMQAEARLLLRTTSGMGIIFPPTVSAPVREVIEAFTEKFDPRG